LFVAFNAIAWFSFVLMCAIRFYIENRTVWISNLIWIQICLQFTKMIWKKKKAFLFSNMAWAETQLTLEPAQPSPATLYLFLCVARSGPTRPNPLTERYPDYPTWLCLSSVVAACWLPTTTCHLRLASMLIPCSARRSHRPRGPSPASPCFLARNTNGFRDEFIP
jgi:hypothetical protein